MKRLPLISRTGCNRCKLRKKKCDEQKPVCNNCQRLKLICAWTREVTKPSSEPMQLRFPELRIEENIGDIVVHRVLPSRDISKPSKVFSNQGQLAFTLSYPDLFGRSVANWWQNDDAEISITMKLALQNADVSNALSAFAARIMYMMTGNASFTAASNQHYAVAVREMRSSVARGLTGVEMICPYFAMGILGYYELSNFGNEVNASYHFIAALQMWHRVLAAFSSDVGALKLLRLTCEGNLYHLAITAMFLPAAQLDTVVRWADWDSLLSIFSRPLLNEPMGCHLSAFHGLQPGLYRLMLEVCHASRSALNKDSRSRQTKQWLTEIFELEESQIGFYAHVPRATQKVGLATSSLYFCALRLWVEKFSDPSKCSSSASVRGLMARGKELIRQCALPINVGFHAIWPLSILMCAARHEGDLEIILQAVNSFWVSPGALVLWQRTVRAIKAMRMLIPCDGRPEDCLGFHDGLDLLLAPDGLPAA